MAAIAKVAATYWGPAGFGEYVLARRTIGWLQLPLLAGVNVAVTRSVATARADSGGVTEEAYICGGILVVALCGFAGVILLNSFAGRIGYVLLGSTNEAALVRSISVALPAALSQGIVYGWLCGRMQMGAANAIQFVNLGVIPLVVFSVAGLTVPRVIATIGALWFIAPACAVVPFVWRSRRQSHEPPRIRAAIRNLITYGYARVPGDLALGGLFALPVTFTAHWGGHTNAGFIALGVSVLSMVGSGFNPLGQILLPSAATMAASNGATALHHLTVKLIFVTCAVGLVATAGVEVCAPALLSWLFGRPFVAGVSLVRVIAIGIVPYGVYVVMRNLLDAVRVAPLNGKNLVITLLAFVLVAVSGKTPLATAIGFTCAMIALGGLTLRDSVRELQRMRSRSETRIGITISGHRLPTLGDVS